jgi:hypothetical protein
MRKAVVAGFATIWLAVTFVICVRPRTVKPGPANKMQATYMQSFFYALDGYATFDPVGGFPDNLRVLGPNASALFLNTEILDRGQLNGYRFEYKHGAADSFGRVSTYTLRARPLQYKRTGTSSFLMDESGMIHWTDENREATTDDAIYY